LLSGLQRRSGDGMRSDLAVHGQGRSLRREQRERDNDKRA